MRLHLRSNRHLLFTSLVLVSCAVVSVFVFNILRQNTASALSARDFNAGRIIDDGVFYNKDSMNVNQIQDMMNRLIPNCDTWGTQPSEYGGGTRAQYAASRGWHGPPYACLNNYHENPITGETSFEKGGGAFAGGVSAAQIIYNAAQAYGINPQVLLVLLKKESAGPLTADTWPLKSQYKYAMGYACPDSGPGYSANCSAEKSGFYKQMTLAAWQLKYYRDHPNDYRYHVGWNDIQYSPEPTCGTKRVYIENMATLSLYIYTPYTPNDGALANYPGTAPCGAYGNRNFFMFFSEWFGTTYGDRWTPLNDPRVMITTKPTYKIDPGTGANLQSLEAGLQIMFPTKTTLSDGTGCLRTLHDTKYNANACIKYADVGEFTPVFEAASSNENVLTKQTSQWTCKVSYRTLQTTDQCFAASAFIDFSKKTTVAGVEYLITKHDWEKGNTLGFRADRTTDTSMQNMTSLDEGTNTQKSLQWTCKLSLPSKTVDSSQCIRENTSVIFSKKLTIDEIEYLVTKHDFERGNNTVFLQERFSANQ